MTVVGMATLGPASTRAQDRGLTGYAEEIENSDAVEGTMGAVDAGQAQGEEALSRDATSGLSTRATRRVEEIVVQARHTRHRPAAAVSTIPCARDQPPGHARRLSVGPRDTPGGF